MLSDDDGNLSSLRVAFFTGQVISILGLGSAIAMALIEKNWEVTKDLVYFGIGAFVTMKVVGKVTEKIPSKKTGAPDNNKS